MMQDLVEFIKSIVRPFIVIWGCIVYGVCVITATKIPQLLAGLISAVVIEYFGERAYQRFKEKQGE
jgi:hypothetical protein